MTYQLPADENVERATVTYLRKLGHDVEWIGTVSDLGFDADDEAIAAYARRTDRLILTQDDDFLTTIDPGETAGVLFRTDLILEGRTVGDFIHGAVRRARSPTRESLPLH